MSEILSSLPQAKFKLALAALILLNAVFYLLAGKIANTLDSLIWLALLLLYEFKANNIAIMPVSRQNWLRDALIAFILMVWADYLISKEWLNAINTFLWIALVALIEIEVRWPALIADRPQIYRGSKMSIFVGLIVMIFAWIWQAGWLDAYDATLWLAALITIEGDVHDVLEQKSV